MSSEGVKQSTATRLWFGPAFAQLHPLLQEVHTQGAVLRGPVRVFCGRGLAGVLGRHFAKRLGVPLGAAATAAGGEALHLEVRITHTAEHLVWTRRFTNVAGQVSEVESLFAPVGHHPDGYWIETTGRMRFKLAVDVLAGAWHWRVLGVSVAGFALPLALLPRSHAFKQVEMDEGGTAYRFSVGFALPIVGSLFSYEGVLRPSASA